MKTIARTFLAALLVATGSAFADSVAFLTNLKGEVAVDANTRPLILAELAKGQKIVLARDAQASVMFIASGKEYFLKGPCEYFVKDKEIESASGMPPMSRSTEWRASNKALSQVAQTSSASVRMRSFAPPKKDNAPRLLFPTQGGIATLQPEMRWRAQGVKSPLEVVVIVPGQEKPVHVGKASGDAYRIAPSLKPDTEYEWRLMAAGDEIGSAKFRTLPADAIRDIDKRKPSDKAEFSDRVLFALYLLEKGAVQEAQASWAKLSQERADLPELAALAR